MALCGSFTGWAEKKKPKTNLAANKKNPTNFGGVFIGLKNQGRFQNTHYFFGQKKTQKSSHTFADERLTPITVLASSFSIFFRLDKLWAL